ncbi:hypothetical protein PI124_g21735 [Phytophthora idaei]|nr:hypothetical protein PI125_g22770 [Phytophthora idaei]KAG3129605.1 hypothetical protein PI126_g20890 [Phytophthora idaei]KAG3233189.1 hypothetical protein PI124_g21735 [Phytophthora idaei]
MPSKRQKNVADDSSEENASVKDLPAEVRVTDPQFSGIFDSWKEMEAAFVRYQRETFQNYSLRTTNSIKKRNRNRATQAARRGSTPSIWD